MLFLECVWYKSRKFLLLYVSRLPIHPWYHYLRLSCTCRRGVLHPSKQRRLQPILPSLTPLPNPFPPFDASAQRLCQLVTERAHRPEAVAPTSLAQVWYKSHKFLFLYLMPPSLSLHLPIHPLYNYLRLSPHTSSSCSPSSQAESPSVAYMGASDTITKPISALRCQRIVDCHSRFPPQSPKLFSQHQCLPHLMIMS